MHATTLSTRASASAACTAALAWRYDVIALEWWIPSVVPAPNRTACKHCFYHPRYVGAHPWPDCIELGARAAGTSSRQADKGSQVPGRCQVDAPHAWQWTC